MNPALVKKALEKVLSPNILVNMVSRRVRQLTSGMGAESQALVAHVDNLGAADIALREIIEDKMGYEIPAFVPLVRPTGRNRKRPQHWARD
jgi:DNA-directed RNA polymerase subunit omega